MYRLYTECAVKFYCNFHLWQLPVSKEEGFVLAEASPFLMHLNIDNTNHIFNSCHLV